jgi:hypothetical protein
VLGDEVTLVVVPAGTIVKLAEPVLPVWFWSPPYVALAVTWPAFVFGL